MASDLNALLDYVVTRAEQLGASSADAVASDYVEGNVRVRLGEIEELTRARERQLGLRVFVGQRQAISATSDLRESALEGFVQGVLAMAQLTAEDPHAGPPDPSATGATHGDDPALYDPAAEGFDLERGLVWALEAEKAALDDPRMKNSEGASFGFGAGLRAFRASGGVSGSYRSSSFSGSVTPVAEVDGAMERDYWYSSRRHVKDLQPAAEVGLIARERTLRRLGARRLPTGERVVVFDPMMASGLLRSLAGALNGNTVYRGASYLRDKLGQSIASSLVTIVDDGSLKGGIATRPFDGEGLVSRRNVLVGGGVLERFLTDTYSARKLGTVSTGNASRGVGDGPTVGTTNLHLLPGSLSPAQLLDGIADGFYVTELIGFGVNVTTGDYSQGAAGVRILNGQLDHAVSEVTVAGNLATMLADIEGIGSDLDLHRGTSAPSLRLRRLMVAGE